MNHLAAVAAAPRIGYWHIRSDTDGVSHPTRSESTAFEQVPGDPIALQWNDKQQRGESTVGFTVQPVGWVGECHEKRAPQWIVDAVDKDVA